jgi:hypothetical protein
MSNLSQIQKFAGLFLFSIVVAVPCVFAETFRGEVTSVDSANGTVNVRYRNQDGQVVSERTFRASPGQGLTSTGMQSISDLEIGDQVSFNAFNRNGTWEIQSFDTATQGNPSAVLPGTATSDANSVFAASPNNSVSSPLFPTATATTTAGGTPLNATTQTSLAAGSALPSRTNSVGSSANFGPSGTMSANNTFSSGNPGGNAATTANSGISTTGTSAGAGSSAGASGAGASGGGAA